jgi:peptidoglycan/LPS O-acetylase OafA/YrhL
MDTKALDGLRGVLALYIVVYHNFLATEIEPHRQVTGFAARVSRHSAVTAQASRCTRV